MNKHMSPRLHAFSMIDGIPTDFVCRCSIGTADFEGLRRTFQLPLGQEKSTT